jgi:hypothetical protein
MVHLANATIQLARMMRAIWFPSSTVGTPLRSAVEFADEDILAVECLESWAIRIRVGRDPWLRLNVPPAASPLLILLAFLLEGFSFGG